MQLAAFNALPAPEAGELVRSCARIPSFVTALTDGRPYPGLGELLATARDRRGCVDRRRGDRRPGRSPPDRRTAHGRRRERRHVRPRAGRRRPGRRRAAAPPGRRQPPVRGALRADLLVRAAGRSGAELLDLLEQRLTNDPATELAVTREQLAEIALLRLEGQVTA